MNNKIKGSIAFIEMHIDDKHIAIFTDFIFSPNLLMAPSAGLEPATYGVEDRCSIQLSYEGNNTL